MNEKIITGEFFNPISGIYKITNTTNGRVYVGQSKEVQARLASHFRDLARGKHNNPELQADWNRCQPGDFIAEIVREAKGNLKYRLKTEAAYMVLESEKGTDLYNSFVPRNRQAILSLKNRDGDGEHEASGAGSSPGSGNTSGANADLFGSWSIPEPEPLPRLASDESRLHFKKVGLRSGGEGIDQEAAAERPAAAGLDEDGQSPKGNRNAGETLSGDKGRSDPWVNELGKYFGYEGVEHGQLEDDIDTLSEHFIAPNEYSAEVVAEILFTYLPVDIRLAVAEILQYEGPLFADVTPEERDRLHALARHHGHTWSEFCRELARPACRGVVIAEAWKFE